MSDLKVGLGPVVDAGWLAEHLGATDLAVIDLRWYLGAPGEGRRAYEAGHIPGAVFIDLEADITGRSGPGLHPLPDAAQFQEAMRRAGVSRDTRVVAYDDAAGSVASRLWWLLRRHGHPAVAILDGGIQAWTGELETSVPEPVPGDFTAAEPDASRVLAYDDLRGAAPTLLLDARSPERYAGVDEPLGSPAGHIPGALSAFWQGNLTSEGRFRDPEDLRRRYVELGVEERAGEEGAVVYCGSGVTSCHTLVALELAGLPSGRLYAGSWSDWMRREGAPVATGDRPGRA